MKEVERKSGCWKGKGYSNQDGRLDTRTGNKEMGEGEVRSRRLVEGIASVEIIVVAVDVLVELWIT